MRTRIYAAPAVKGLNRARRTSWGWWVEWDDTALRTNDSIFNTWRSEASTLTLGHAGYPQYRILTSERVMNILFLWNLEAKVGFKPAISDYQAGSFNHYTRAPATRLRLVDDHLHKKKRCLCWCYICRFRVKVLCGNLKSQYHVLTF